MSTGKERMEGQGIQSQVPVTHRAVGGQRRSHFRLKRSGKLHGGDQMRAELQRPGWTVAGKQEAACG